MHQEMNILDNLIQQIHGNNFSCALLVKFWQRYPGY